MSLRPRRWRVWVECAECEQETVAFVVATARTDVTDYPCEWCGVICERPRVEPPRWHNPNVGLNVAPENRNLVRNMALDYPARP